MAKNTCFKLKPSDDQKNDLLILGTDTFTRCKKYAFSDMEAAQR